MVIILVMYHYRSSEDRIPSEKGQLCVKDPLGIFCIPRRQKFPKTSVLSRPTEDLLSMKERPSAGVPPFESLQPLNNLLKVFLKVAIARPLESLVKISYLK